MKDYVIIDLVDSGDSYIWDKFRDTLRFIQEEDNIRNKKNYEGLEDLVDKHISFTVLMPVEINVCLPSSAIFFNNSR